MRSANYLNASIGSALKFFVHHLTHAGQCSAVNLRIRYECSYVPGPHQFDDIKVLANIFF